MKYSIHYIYYLTIFAAVFDFKFTLNFVVCVSSSQRPFLLTLFYHKACKTPNNKRVKTNIFSIKALI
jgi:hypothetical protein